MKVSCVFSYIPTYFVNCLGGDAAVRGSHNATAANSGPEFDPRPGKICGRGIFCSESGQPSLEVGERKKLMAKLELYDILYQ